VRVADRPAGGESPLRIAIVPPVEALSGPPRRVAERLAAAGSVIDTPIHGALLVAQGEADVCLQPIGGPWDLAAVSLIVEEAGGRFSDLAGRADVHGGGPALYGTPSGHAAALAALSPR
jgi:histidinol-phosphatase